ncbi:hypothetical protein [Mesoterricola silvestris]|nr:hypothetical protein [Mesoterricola silvestris]
MRFVPLVPSENDPRAHKPFHAIELAWTGRAHPAWTGLPVHAIHLPPAPWDEGLGETAMAALRARLEPDFLVLHAEDPEARMEVSRFLGVLEGLLEITHGQGVKLALRPAPGAAPALVKRLREARGEAVGFCWDRTVGPDLECISDRLFCAVGGPGDDFSGLEALGYRWNVAVPRGEGMEELARAWPEVLFRGGGQ